MCAAGIKEQSCANCGAAVSVTQADLQAKCPFCGTVYRTEGTQAGQRLAELLEGERVYVVEPELDENRVRQAIFKWLGSGFFTPSGFRERIAKVTMTAVNIPAVGFEARAESRWQGEDSRTEQGGGDGAARTVTVRREGTRTGNYTQLVAVSTAVSQKELEAMDFRMEDMKLLQSAPEMNVELPSVSSKQDLDRVRETARGIIEEKERHECASLCGRLISCVTNVVFNGRFFMFAPVAVYNYDYAGKRYRVVAERKKGRVTGSRPVSAVKVTLFVLGIAAVIAGAALLFLKYKPA